MIRKQTVRLNVSLHRPTSTYKDLLQYFGRISCDRGSNKNWWVFLLKSGVLMDQPVVWGGKAPFAMAQRTGAKYQQCGECELVCTRGPITFTWRMAVSNDGERCHSNVRSHYRALCWPGYLPSNGHIKSVLGCWLMVTDSAMNGTTFGRGRSGGGRLGGGRGKREDRRQYVGNHATPSALTRHGMA